MMRDEEEKEHARKWTTQLEAIDYDSCIFTCSFFFLIPSISHLSSIENIPYQSTNLCYTFAWSLSIAVCTFQNYFCGKLVGRLQLSQFLNKLWSKEREKTNMEWTATISNQFYYFIHKHPTRFWMAMLSMARMARMGHKQIAANSIEPNETEKWRHEYLIACG